MRELPRKDLFSASWPFHLYMGQMAYTSIRGFAFSTLSGNFVVSTIRRIARPTDRFFHFYFFRTTAHGYQDARTGAKNRGQTLQVIQCTIFISNSIDATRDNIYFFANRIFVGRVGRRRIIVDTTKGRFMTTFRRRFCRHFDIFDSLLLMDFRLELRHFFRDGHFANSCIRRQATLAAERGNEIRFFMRLFTAAFHRSRTTTQAHRNFIDNNDGGIDVEGQIQMSTDDGRTHGIHRVGRRMDASTIDSFARFHPIRRTKVYERAASGRFQLIFFNLFFRVNMISVANDVSAMEGSIMRFAKRIGQEAIDRIATVHRIRARGNVA